MFRFFKSLRNYKLAIFGIFLVAAILIPSLALAQQSSGSNCSWWQLGCKAIAFVTDGVYGIVADVLFFVATVVSSVAGVIIAVESWFLQIILNINLSIVNSTPVKLGFPVVLSIANLMFVAGLIIIAMATIVRQTSYGAKKILWKLVVMAILVNFGLVICGAILNVSDNLALYFINSVNPLGAGDTGTGTLSQIWNFVNSFSGAFNPYGLIRDKGAITLNPTESVDAYSGAVLGQELGQWLVPFAALLGTIGSLLIIIITLGVLIAMLLFRYVKLGMLLIILPLAWAAFVFPAYTSHYKKWWQDFSKWAVFPPVVIFFLWLTLKISEAMNNAGQSEFNFALYQSETNVGAWAQVADFFSNLFSPIVEQMLRIFILWGITMGGLWAANSMGIKFADAGIKAVEKSGNWAKERTGARARNIGKRYDPRTKETTTWLQRKGAGLQNPRLKIPFTSIKIPIPGLGVVTRPLGVYLAGEGNTNKRYDEGIEKERKRLESLNKEGILASARARSADPILQAAKAQELARRKLLDPNEIGNGDAVKGEKILKRLVESADKMGNSQALYNVRPDLVKYSDKVAREKAAKIDRGMPAAQAEAEAIREAIVEAVKKIPASEAGKMSHPSLGSQTSGTTVSEEVGATLLNLGNGHLGKIGSEGSLEQQQAVINSLEEMFSSSQINGRSMTTEEQNSVNRIKKHLEDNPNWSYPP